jgi:uncharacterized membrane protein YcaP (DUF421 family)
MMNFLQINYIRIILKLCCRLLIFHPDHLPVCKKKLAQLSVYDQVFILLISNAVQNAMAGPETFTMEE